MIGKATIELPNRAKEVDSKGSYNSKRQFVIEVADCRYFKAVFSNILLS
jgi:hypothetical protein